MATTPRARPGSTNSTLSATDPLPRYCTAGLELRLSHLRRLEPILPCAPHIKTQWTGATSCYLRDKIMADPQTFFQTYARALRLLSKERRAVVLLALANIK